jgi:hypothetical protein
MILPLPPETFAKLATDQTFTRHCERSEAIQDSFGAAPALDCFVPAAPLARLAVLAMTSQGTTVGT